MNILNYAPILIPTLNRYEHLKRCVASLAKNKLAKESELVIGLDYPPQEKYQEGWEKIKAFLPTISGFGKVTILSADKNIGAVNNGNKLKDYIKGKGYTAFILTEDDNEFAPNFLEYINWGLKTYKNDKGILAICGFKRVDVNSLQNNVYKYPQFNAWGYGMWYDRRDKLTQLANLEMFKELLKKSTVFDAFTDKAYILASLVSMIETKKILGDVLPNLLPKEEQWCVFPTVNKVINYGHDGSGLHGGTSSQYEYYRHLPLDTDLNFTPHIVTELYQPEIEKKYKEIYCHYSRKMHLYGMVVFLVYKLTGRVLHRNKGGRWPLFWLKKVE